MSITKQRLKALFKPKSKELFEQTNDRMTKHLKAISESFANVAEALEEQEERITMIEEQSEELKANLERIDIKSIDYWIKKLEDKT